MKVVTPEISWHGKDAIFSIDIQPLMKEQLRRIVTAGLDNNVRVWQLKNSEIKFLSNLSRHEKAVNVVRFSKKSLIIASGGDDGTIVLWKLSDKEDVPNIFSTDDGSNIEVWNAFKSLRGHLEDINDLSWSHDDVYLVSGSVDHTAILWDVEKGQKLVILSDSKHFINGVAWDPLNNYVATMSCDRSLRIYNLQTKKMMHCVNKIPYLKQSKSNEQPAKPQRIFHDETVVRRRLAFTVDGKLLITPAGCLQSDSITINTAMIFSRNSLSKPCVFLPGFKEPASVVACCPVLFELRNSEKESTFKLEYRHIFAVASSDSVVLYDTQQSTPFGLISNIHYASITDLSWSPDASFLAISSRDGFCSIVFFEADELGQPYIPSESKPSAKPEESLCVSSDQLKPTELTDVVSKSTSDNRQVDEKENLASQENPYTLPMEVEESLEKTNSPLISSEKCNENQNGITAKTMPSRINAPRRIELEAVKVAPGSSLPLGEKQNSVNQSSNGPRRVQLIPVSK